MVFELPPSESFSNHVSTLSRYGMNTVRFEEEDASLVELTSASADITEPRVTSDLLIWAPSFSRCPVAPVAFARSLGKRDKKYNTREQYIQTLGGCLDL